MVYVYGYWRFGYFVWILSKWRANIIMIQTIADAIQIADSLLLTDWYQDKKPVKWWCRMWLYVLNFDMCLTFKITTTHNQVFWVWWDWIFGIWWLSQYTVQREKISLQNRIALKIWNRISFICVVNRFSFICHISIESKINRFEYVMNIVYRLVIGASLFYWIRVIQLE